LPFRTRIQGDRIKNAYTPLIVNYIAKIFLFLKQSCNLFNTFSANKVVYFESRSFPRNILDYMKTYFTSINRTALALIIVVLSSISSIAQDRNYVAISSAVFDILQQSDPSFESRVEFRLGKVNMGGHPFSGVMVNTEGAMHIYLGLYYDFPIAGFLFITPSFAPGLYAKNNSKDLKFALEFRSQIEISIKFVNGARVGFSFNHISNATLGEENPGVESLAVTYIIPL